MFTKPINGPKRNSAVSVEQQMGKQFCKIVAKNRGGGGGGGAIAVEIV
jgi:hypothetical protein